MQSLDRRKAKLRAAAVAARSGNSRRSPPHRARSTGALNLLDMDQSAAGMFGGFSGRGMNLIRARATSPAILHYGDSKISLGGGGGRQVSSDHIDKYRDVAL